MAPKAIDAAIADRDVITLDVAVMEDRVAEHEAGNQIMSEEVVTVHLQSLETIRGQLTEINKRIFLAAPADIDDHKLLYKNLSAKIFEMLSSLQAIRKTFPVSGSTSESSGTSSNVRLPTLEIPTFDGTLMDWPQFRDMFDSIVNQNSKLSKAQKLAHVKASVTGEAARLIKNLNVTDGNYDIAMTQLTDGYQKNRDLLFAVYRRFLGQQPVNTNSSTSIRNLTDVIKECIWPLEVVSICRNDEIDSILLYIIFTKIDGQSKELWEQTLKNSETTSLDALFEFLEQRARSLSAASGSTKVQGHHHPKPEDKQKRVQVHFTQDHPPCKSCRKSNHLLFKCEAFLGQTVATRRETIKNLQLCFTCLRRGHSSKKCSSPFRCKTCKSALHSLLHLQDDKEDKAEGGSTIPLAFTQQISQTNQPHLPGNMLATAIVDVYNNGIHHVCRALLNSGSTNSLITEECVTRRGLQRRKYSAVITGLQSSTVATARGITSFSINPHFKTSPSTPVSALIVSKVIGNLPLYPCNSEKWIHLKGLTLADPSFGRPGAIDQLLGSDLFWDLLREGKKSGPAGTPQAI